MSNSNTKTPPPLKASTMVDYASVSEDKVLPEHKIHSLHAPKQLAHSTDEILEVPHDILAGPIIAAARTSINWNYVVLMTLILATFFLMIKVAYEPVEPIIIMDEPVSSLIANETEIPESIALQSPLSPESESEEVLLPSDSNGTPSTASPAEEMETQEVTKSATKIETAPIDKTSQEWLEIELAKKKAKQNAKKELEKAMQQKPAETKPTPQPQENNVPQQIENAEQKVPIGETTKTKKEAAVKEAVPEQDKSIWFKFADSITQGAEAPCSPAQKAMNQCN